MAPTKVVAADKGVEQVSRSKKPVTRKTVAENILGSKPGTSQVPSKTKLATAVSKTTLKTKAKVIVESVAKSTKLAEKNSTKKKAEIVDPISRKGSNVQKKPVSKTSEQIEDLKQSTVDSTFKKVKKIAVGSVDSRTAQKTERKTKTVVLTEIKTELSATAIEELRDNLYKKSPLPMRRKTKVTITAEDLETKTKKPQKKTVNNIVDEKLKKPNMEEKNGSKNKVLKQTNDGKGLSGNSTKNKKEIDPASKKRNSNNEKQLISKKKVAKKTTAASVKSEETSPINKKVPKIDLTLHRGVLTRSKTIILEKQLKEAKAETIDKKNIEENSVVQKKSITKKKSDEKSTIPKMNKPTKLKKTEAVKHQDTKTSVEYQEEESSTTVSQSDGLASRMNSKVLREKLKKQNNIDITEDLDEDSIDASDKDQEADYIWKNVTDRVKAIEKSFEEFRISQESVVLDELENEEDINRIPVSHDSNVLGELNQSIEQKSAEESEECIELKSNELQEFEDANKYEFMEIQHQNILLQQIEDTNKFEVSNGSILLQDQSIELQHPRKSEESIEFDDIINSMEIQHTLQVMEDSLKLNLSFKSKHQQTADEGSELFLGETQLQQSIGESIAFQNTGKIIEVHKFEDSIDLNDSKESNSRDFDHLKNMKKPEDGTQDLKNSIARLQQSIDFEISDGFTSHHVMDFEGVPSVEFDESERGIELSASIMDGIIASEALVSE